LDDSTFTRSDGSTGDIAGVDLVFRTNMPRNGLHSDTDPLVQTFEMLSPSPAWIANSAAMNETALRGQFGI